MIGTQNISAAYIGDKRIVAGYLGAIPMTGVWLWHYASDAIVTVILGADSAENGVNLATAYAATKLLTPNGGALSAANRACVILPVAEYELTATLVLDTEYVDLIAEHPSSGGAILETDLFCGVDGATPTSLDFYRPPPTIIFAEIDGIATISQQARDVRMRGFGVAQLFPNEDLGVQSWPAIDIAIIDDQANGPSVYDTLYVWSRSAYEGYLGYPIQFSKHVRGTYNNCIFGYNSLRCNYGGEFSATVTNSQVGPYSIGGDIGLMFKRCRLVNVECIGKVGGRKSGFGGFGGCALVGIPDDEDCVFRDCKSGPHSYCIGTKAVGTYTRCQGGEYSFAGTSVLFQAAGEFAGTATDCEGGPGSFGGTCRTDAGKLTGTLVRCNISGELVEVGANPTKPWRTEGAVITDSVLETKSENTDCVNLLDGNTVITGTTLLVDAGGTGIPINAASPQNVFAQNCTMNNAANDADGLGANVTNLANPANNAVT